MQKSQIILFSPSVIIRKGLKSVIEKDQNIEVIAQIDSIDDLKENKIEYDYIIIDSQLNKSKEFTTLISSLIDKSKIIWLNIEKSETNKEVSISLNQTQKKILETLQNLIGESSESKKITTPDGISKREIDILKYIAMGYSNKEVADKLFLSTHTVVTHRKNITRKLGIKTAPGLTIYAILNKIIDVNDTEKI